MRVKMLLIAELDTGYTGSGETPQAMLDHFREAVEPNLYGLSLYRATPQDLRAFQLPSPIGPASEAVVPAVPA